MSKASSFSEAYMSSVSDDEYIIQFQAKLDKVFDQGKNILEKLKPNVN